MTGFDFKFRKTRILSGSKKYRDWQASGHCDFARYHTICDEEIQFCETPKALKKHLLDQVKLEGGRRGYYELAPILRIMRKTICL